MLHVFSTFAANNATCDNNYVAYPPTINIKPFLNSDDFSSNEYDDMLLKIRSACHIWGFFHIVGHDLEAEQEELLLNTKSFFQLPSVEKIKIKRFESNSRGFADDELTKQKRDRKQIFDMGHKPFIHLPDNAVENRVLDGYNQWPSETYFPTFKEGIEKYYNLCVKLGRTVMSLIAVSFDLEKDFFDEYFNNHTSFLRLNFYPVTTLNDNKEDSDENNTSDNLGISRHTDAGMLTLLIQNNVSALQVYSGTKEDAGDGKWVDVSPNPGSFTINTGDMLQVLSNNKIKAPEHRVLASTDAERYSAALFLNPNYDSNIKPSSKFVDETMGESVVYDPINWGEFRSLRFKGDYADYGREVQIENYRRN